MFSVFTPHHDFRYITTRSHCGSAVRDLLIEPDIAVYMQLAHFKMIVVITLIDVYICTVVSEKKGTFICEIVMERYIYLRNTQKQLKITNYVRNKSFLEFYLVVHRYNGVCLKFLGSLL